MKLGMVFVRMGLSALQIRPSRLPRRRVATTSEARVAAAVVRAVVVHACGDVGDAAPVQLVASGRVME